MTKLYQQSVRYLLPVAIFMAAISPVHADNDKGRGNGHGKAQAEREYGHDRNEYRKGSKSDDVWIPLSILSDDRSRIERYWQDNYKRHCPPGLAKKRNGCQPPGQAKKYRVGEHLPDGIFIPLPNDLLDMLQPPPRGHQYVRVDRDVYLITEAGHKIIDAVTLLSAAGN